MTQPPDSDSVLAPFAGESLVYQGFRATMMQDAQGYWMEFQAAPSSAASAVEPAALPGPAGDQLGPAPGPGQGLRRRVALCVGSHRYQQYMTTAADGALVRLPLAWHVAEQRWIHLNGAFVEPEGREGDWQDYQRHVTRWNDNCLFCHNTGASPGFDPTVADGRFESRVEEYGIACEACHGAGLAHATANRNPFRRLVAGGRGQSDIVGPHRLGARPAADICGRCHGQRIGHDIARVLRDGDGFRPGRDLSEISRPIFRDSQVSGLPEGIFAQRFWPDGTPRLSAYEYQGLLLSPCAQPQVPPGRQLQCEHCHTMHGEAPDDQLRPSMRSDVACLQCHPADTLTHAQSPGGHSGHEAPVDCMDCHMPYLTYGLLEGMRSHRIQLPMSPAVLEHPDQPDACSQCHVDRSRTWALDSYVKLFPGSAIARRGPPTVASLASEVEPRVPRALETLILGDALARNLAAHAIQSHRAEGDLGERRRWLAVALDDPYPSVRWFAWRGLRRLATTSLVGPARLQVLKLLAEFDYLGPLPERIELQSRLLERLGPAAHQAEIDNLRREASERPQPEIWIGE